MRGCTADNELDTARFSRPLPWIGLYVAGASLLCGLGMAADAFRGFRNRRLWFPTRFFPLNATTLTLLSVATKFPVDLNTSMPSRADQLSKLSSTVLICTILGNFVPSLGSMSGSDIASNGTALAILVVTVVANMGIQIGTGVIYVFLPEHCIVLSFMLVLLAFLLSSALAVDVTKRELNDQFDKRYKELDQLQKSLSREGDVDPESSRRSSMRWETYSPERLTELIKRYWLMAHTGSPQFVIGRSATCTASGAFCLLATMVLIEAAVKSFIQHSMFCSGSSESDYGWSTTVVLVVQAAAIFVGTIAPAYRWFSAISFRGLNDSDEWSCKKEFMVESYWVKMLKDLKEAPLQFHIRTRWRRKVAHEFKKFVLSGLILMQKLIVILSKSIRLLSMWLPLWLNKANKAIGYVSRREMLDRSLSEQDLEGFVLRLQGEDDLVTVITKSGRIDTKKWIQKGSSKKPTKLIELITEKYSNSRGGFNGTRAFDSKGIPRLFPVQHEPDNCWALPIVTLASIAVALHGNNNSSINFLMHAVDEGLRYVRTIEHELDTKGLVTMREAADIAWTKLYLYNEWFGVKLRSLSSGEDSNKSIVTQLQSTAKGRVETFWKQESKNETTNSLEWPEDVLAANSMYRLTSTILESYDDQAIVGSDSYPSLPRTDNNLYAWIETTIADILRACLTNLPEVIYAAFINSRIEVREENIRKAALMFGEAKEDIIGTLCNEEIQAHLPENKDFIDNWRKDV